MKNTQYDLLCKSLFILVTSVFAQVSVPTFASADGDPYEQQKRKGERPVVAPHNQRMEQSNEAPRASYSVPDKRETMKNESCEWRTRLSPGMTTWFFDKENTLAGPALFVDVWRTDIPLNFHIGIEGRSMYLGQDAVKYEEEFKERTAHVTFIRIPFALEYMIPIADQTTWYLGGGPDIIHTANDVTETDVGMHLGTRVHYALTQNLGVAMEAGYMWGSLERGGDNIVLDNAYITPTIAYTF